MTGDYLTKLRQKPKHVRDNIAFGVASGITGLVALFLVFAVHGPKVVGDIANQDDSPHFFETLVNQAKEQMASSRASFDSQKEEKNTATTTPAAAANGSGAPAPAILVSSTSIETASNTPRTVLIATTSASGTKATSADVGR